MGRIYLDNTFDQQVCIYLSWVETSVDQAVDNHRIKNKPFIENK